jgi:hypothetical protein
LQLWFDFSIIDETQMCSLIVNIESLKKLNVLKSLETYINRYIWLKWKNEETQNIYNSSK